MPALDLVWVFWGRFRRLNGSVLAGHVAYRLFLWLAPFVLVLVSLVGYSVASNIDLVEHASTVGASEEFTDSVVSQAERGRTASLVIGASALIVATWSLVRAMFYVSAQVWELDPRPPRRMTRRIGLTVLGALVVTGTFLVLTAVQRSGPLFAVSGWFAGVAITTGVLWLVSWVLPRRPSSAFDLLPGPVLAALAFSGLQLVAGVYLPARIASASELYGALGVAFGILFYLFVTAYLLVGTGFVNAVWTDRSEILAGRPMVVDPDVLPRWMRRPVRWLVRDRR